MALTFQHLFIAKRRHFIKDNSIKNLYEIFKSTIGNYKSIPSFQFLIKDISGIQLELKPKPKYSIESYYDHGPKLSLLTGLIEIGGQQNWYKGKNSKDTPMQDLIVVKLNNEDNIYLLVAPQLYAKGTSWKKFCNYDLSIICDEAVEQLKDGLFEVEAKRI